MEKPVENPIVARIKSGDVPEAAKLNAARGLLPIEIQDLVGLLVFLTSDASSEVAEAASGTLNDYPEEQIGPILEDEAAPPEVLAYFARSRDSEVLAQKLLLNPGTPDEAIEAMAERVSAPLLEIIVKNEVRLIRHPPILDRLEANPHAGPAIKRRCQEIRTDFIDKAAAAGGATPEAAEEDEASQAAVEQEEAPPEAGAEDEEEPTEALKEILSFESEEDDDPNQKKLTLEQKIMQLTVSEKIKLAYLGGRQARMILIRDPNRTVCASVLEGGKLSASEVELITQFRNIDDEVLRRFSTMKQYMKNYNIVHNLVKNPRTPLGVSMPLLNRLQNADLKRLVNNNNVSGVLRQNAKRLTKKTRLTSGG